MVFMVSVSEAKRRDSPHILTSVTLIFKSYFHLVSEKKVIPSLSEFVGLNIDFIARSAPKTNGNCITRGISLLSQLRKY